MDVVEFVAHSVRRCVAANLRRIAIGGTNNGVVDGMLIASRDAICERIENGEV